MGAWQSLRSCSLSPKWTAEDDFLDSRDREEDIAKFPYVEFTGRDSITCPSCQGSGYIPTAMCCYLLEFCKFDGPVRTCLPTYCLVTLYGGSCRAYIVWSGRRSSSVPLNCRFCGLEEQVNELVALIPYHDQRLKPRRTKFYILVSVLLCLLASGLVVFFLFPHSVIVEDNGIKVVRVWFDRKNSLVILTIKATLQIRNSNFYSVAVSSLTSQVQYMNSVVGTYQMHNVTTIQPLSNKLVNFTVKSKMGGPSFYAYFFCTLSRIRVHNIVIFMRTSVKISYLGHVTQSSLETHHYVDCGADSVTASGPEPTPAVPEHVAPRKSSVRKLMVIQ